MADTMIPGGVVAMMSQAVDRLVKLDSGDAALLYLYCLRHGSVNGLNWSEQRLRPAFEQLRSQGLAPQEAALPDPPVKHDTPPEYALEDITTALGDRGSTFPALCDEVERRLGRVLSPNDLKCLYTLYDYLNLPVEVILLLVSWCCEAVERRYGPGKKPSMPQIKKEGFAWVNRGIDTMELAEAHIQRLTHLNSRGAEVLRLLDIPDRPLVEREKKYIEAWDDMGFEDGAIRLAYEKTIMKKQSMDWGYMNAILRNWHAKGLHTAAAVQAGDKNPRAIQGGYRVQNNPPAENRQAREDMERMRRLMEQMKKED